MGYITSQLAPSDEDQYLDLQRRLARVTENVFYYTSLLGQARMERERLLVEETRLRHRLARLPTPAPPVRFESIERADEFEGFTN